MNTVSRYVLDQLAAFGTKLIYGVAGDTQLHLIAETAGHQSIRFVPVCNENSAGFMAATEAMLTGRVGVCVATSGPGVANMLNGLGEAYGDKLPVLALTGQVEMSKIGTEGKQYLEQQVMLRPLAAYSAEVVDTEAVGKVLPMALLKALTRRQLTHVSIPKDLLPQMTSATAMARPLGLENNYMLSALALKQALQLINTSRRPLILAGLGAFSAMPELVKLAQAWGAGIITSLGAKGALARNEPNYVFGLGQGGSEAASQLLASCDLLFVVGCNWWPNEFISTPPHVIQVDINPEAIGCGPIPHVALIGDAREVSWQIRAELRTEASPEWLQIISQEKSRWEGKLSQELQSESGALHPARVMKTLEDLNLTEIFCTVDTGDHTVWFNKHYHGLCRRVFFSGKWRTMGFALPGAIAAALTEQGTRVLCITGDGCLNMGLAELATLARENLPVTVLVLNNHAYTMEKNRMLNAGLAPVGVDLPAIDYVKVAQACGLQTVGVADEQGLKSALQQALQSHGPCLISVEVGSPMLPHTTL